MVVEFSNLKKKSNLIHQLKTIYGISKVTAQKICNTIGVGNSYKYENLNSIQKYYLKLYINNLLLTEVDLKQQIEKQILILKLNNSYLGLRHKLGYPVRGQRTRSNAKTCSRSRITKKSTSSKIKIKK